MKKLIATSIILSLLWSCNYQTKKEKPTESDRKIEIANTEFENYISTLDKIVLPLKTNPFGKLPEISKDFDKNAFKNYKHTWTSKPLGIYYQNINTVGIIDCSIGDWGLVPFLTTYDLKGNKIDSTGFYKKSGQDIGYEAIEHLTFNPDRTITVIDSVKSWDFNNDKTDIVEGSMRMRTGIVKYLVLENGKIKKSKSITKNENIEGQTEVKVTSNCRHPNFFDFKNYKEYCVTDTISIDLNGNGTIEKIYFEQKDCPKLIIDEKGKDLISIGCGKEENLGFPNAVGWVDLWCVVYDKETFEILVEDGV